MSERASHENTSEAGRSAVRVLAATVAIAGAVLLEASVGEGIDPTWLTVGLVLFVAALVAARAPSLFWVARGAEPTPTALEPVRERARQPASGTSIR
ncbi:MAG: hypothetical protein R3B82_18395 [Sandaracinaceae bacterium]